MTRTSSTGYLGSPNIVVARNGRWESLDGHRCATVSEAERYCADFGADTFKVAYDGEELPPCPPEPPKPEPIALSDETRAMLQAMWDKA